MAGLQSSPTTHILKAAAKCNCQVPLSSIEKCQCTYCTQNANNKNTESRDKQLEDNDEYWSTFLKAQKNSTANYIYKIKTFGRVSDPTLVKKEPMTSTETINQRVVKMSYTGGLLRSELFYLLSFVLNLMELPVQKQKLYVEHMLNRKLLDRDIINYLQMVSQHASAGLSDSQLKQFQQILQHSRTTNAATATINYYNPEHIFLDYPNGMNPYEEEYIRDIFSSNRKLTSQQTMYLAKLVYKLQQLDDTTRDEYLRFLRERQILSFNKFEYVVAFLVTRAKRIDGEKLRKLLRELETLMGTGPCEPEPEPVKTAIKKEVQKKHIQIDYLKLDKAFRHLMECVVPNIVRLTDLKTFLKEMMAVSDDQVLKVFNSLKIANIMTKQRFNFVENFIQAGRLGKLDKNKRQRFIELLKSVDEGLPLKAEAMMHLVLPASKGPIKEQVDSKEVKEVEKTKKSPTKLDKKQEQTEQRQSETGNGSKKQITKKPLKKKAAKKKK